MTDESREQLLKIAEQELAVAQVDVIRNAFDELDVTKQALEAAKSHVEMFEEESTRDKKRISTLQKAVTADEDLAIRESAVTDREHMCALSGVRLECEVEKRQLAVQLFNIVFSNVEIKRSVLREHDRNYTDATGMYRTDSVKEQTIETETEEG